MNEILAVFVVDVLIDCESNTMKEMWLADIACVYAMISFLAVVVLTKIYIGIYRKKILDKENE